MKSFLLIVHQKNFSVEDLIINQKDYPDAKVGDILEVYHSSQEDDVKNHNGKSDEEEFPRLLLQINTFADDATQQNSLQKDTISVEQSIAQTFGLQTYKTVTIRTVVHEDVALDSVELTFKDQYLGRSEMWRLRNSLANTCVYVKKLLEFCGGNVRCQVHEMWARGDRVACGVITCDTKLVFRSSTSLVYLFLQMSAEMWEFDIYGDLYFEKAVNGFLTDLFNKWRKHGSNHEVTIVLFSRTFYDAHTLAEFPTYMRDCLQKDYKSRYYEDFYRIAAQNEKYDDWTSIVIQLRHIFSQYLSMILEYHQRAGVHIPKARNSTAAEGNFLEVLNMSLNAFEKHYLDRSFDRTGQLSVVVTPGVGVFEVDRDLANITKQRIIDNGVGSDLVCVGEQPLHAVPLLKFHNKDSSTSPTAATNISDDYSMPHWINLSFYSSNKKIAYSSFVPRIKIPMGQQSCHTTNNSNQPLHPNSNQKLLQSLDNYMPNSFYDYDAYDAQVFQIPPNPSVPNASNQHRHHQKPKNFSCLLSSEEMAKVKGRRTSDPSICSVSSDPIDIPSQLNCNNTHSKELTARFRVVVGSEGSPSFYSKALVNPFDPSHVTIKLTSNRRRWAHIFPKGPTGVLIQQHHYQAIPMNIGCYNESKTNCDTVVDSNLDDISSNHSSVTSVLLEYFKKKPTVTHGVHNNSATIKPKKQFKSLTLLWGATGEQEWTPALTTGVDWKSLIIPACLPLTTDYFPDSRALDYDYVVSLYTLIPDSVNADFVHQNAACRRPPLSTEQVIHELISQRLSQGFQLILMPDTTSNDNNSRTCSYRQKSTTVNNSNDDEVDECYYLSIGRLFHKISLSGNTISVTRYRPRHPYPGFNYQYRYRFHAPYHDAYEESYATFATEKLDHYNWNYVDHYVCTAGGDSDQFTMLEVLKYWRFRIYLLPLQNCGGTKKILDGCDYCDVYEDPADTIGHQQIIDGLLKFVETVGNKLKRVTLPPLKKPRIPINNAVANNVPLIQPRRNSMSNFSQFQSVSCNSPFRERLGSNRLSDRPRPRSGSKVVDKSKLLSQDGLEIQQNSPLEIPINESIITCESSQLKQQLTLTWSASNEDIIEAFKHPKDGLWFFSACDGVPQWTFVAVEAVTWLISHIEDVITQEMAVQRMQDLHRADLISHASGDEKRTFCYGFILFYIVDSDSQQCTSDNVRSYDNDWMEVEIKPALNWGVPNDCPMKHFVCRTVKADYAVCNLNVPLYKRIRLDVDVTGKSDRIEWGHLRYQTFFRPDQAYEMVVEWLTASGGIIAELLTSLYRKAQLSGLQMIPIPHDPLALPYSSKSDPLRGPIFIHLAVNCLEEKCCKSNIDGSKLERLFLLQEAILQRFGFIQCGVVHCNQSSTQQDDFIEHQYIHTTGTVFVQINRMHTKSLTKPIHTIGGKQCSEIRPSPKHESYITRHVSGRSKKDYDNTKKYGFLWSWNHMISKRWRINQAVDNNFQIKFLKDFKNFCRDADGRLNTFWKESWHAAE